MAMCLSFSEEFFSGDGTYDYYEMPPSDRPTNVLQAIRSLDDETRKGIAKDVLGIDEENLDFAINAETFDMDVLDKIRENDSCDDASSPVTVYIDRHGWYSVTVYE